MSHRTGPRGGRRLRLLARKLDLTDDQVETLRSRLAEHRAQGREIVRSVLDDEQKQRFDRHVDRHRHHGRRRHRAERR